MVTLGTIKTVNGWDIQQRSGAQAKAERLPRYVVVYPDGRIMEEFRRLVSAVKWCEENDDAKPSGQIEGKVNVCCHYVTYRYWDFERPADEYDTERLEEAAEERAKECIIDGCHSGEVNTLYVHDDGKGEEVRGWWEIDRS